jgi:D-threo-aldose 1-dehydrogenase
LGVLANPAVAAVIPGASKPERIAEDYAALQAVVPAEFWIALRAEGLVAAAAPSPGACRLIWQDVAKLSF